MFDSISRKPRRPEWYKLMMTIVGFILIVGGIVAGFVVGGYYCVYGGVLQIIKGATSNPIIASDVAFGVLRFMATGIVIWLVIIICAVIGQLFMIAGED